MIPLKDNIKRRSWPLVNIFFIGINIVVFIYEIRFLRAGTLENFISVWSVVPPRLLSNPWGDWPTLFTAMFLHGGWSHISGNMLYLWIFGDNVEDRLGHLRYLIFYLLVGTTAHLFQVYFYQMSRVPMLGASGAIAGVLGAYFILYPKAKVLTVVPIWIFLRIVEVPAIFFLGFWFVVQALQSVGSITQTALHGHAGGVAWWAHSGGFLAGLFFVWFFKKKKRRQR